MYLISNQTLDIITWRPEAWKRYTRRVPSVSKAITKKTGVVGIKNSRSTPDPNRKVDRHEKIKCALLLRCAGERAIEVFNTFDVQEEHKDD